MIPQVTLNWPSTIEFGSGKVNTLIDHLNDCNKIFILSDPPIKETIDPIVSRLESGDFGNKTVMVSTKVVPEPPMEALDELLAPVAEFAPDAVVGIGGGSAMDLAKLVAVLFSGDQKITDIIGIGNVLKRDVKLIAVSTTSGTGSEATPIAVITDVAQKLKKGVVSKHIIPDVAIVDPELTKSVPPAITAATGMDAMTHCIEAYTNKHSHPIIDNLTLEGIRLIGNNLLTAVTSPDNIEARTAVALGSLYGGMALGPVNTAAVHALAYPLGGEFKIPHGVANSVLLPYVMNFNMRDCSQKYANIGVALGIKTTESDSDDEIAKKAVMKVRQLSIDCKIPQSLTEFGINESSIDQMAESAMKVTRLLENNPRTITLEDARNIFQSAIKGELD